MEPTTLDRSYRKGDRGRNVTRIQEWLCLHDVHLAVDADFGPATEAGVKRFQAQRGLPASGIVTPPVFEALAAPMAAVLEPLAPGRRTLGALAAAYARQHRRQRPREIGGQNRGPWVRLYMKGHEGDAWPWCAGFACFVLQQACETLGARMPITASFSCDSLAASARSKGLFVPGAEASNGTEIPAGSFFLNRRTSTDWVHTGLVLDAEPEVFRTIEGNTNDEGSREGYEVCERIRGYDSKDFIRVE